MDFLLIFYDFHRFSLICMNFRSGFIKCLMIFIDSHWLSMDFHWFYIGFLLILFVFRIFSMDFNCPSIDYQVFSVIKFWRFFTLVLILNCLSSIFKDFHWFSQRFPLPRSRNQDPVANFQKNLVFKSRYFPTTFLIQIISQGVPCLQMVFRHLIFHWFSLILKHFHRFSTDI